jgi:hypothetical protein
MPYIRVTRGQWSDVGVLDSEQGRQLRQELTTTVKGLPGNQGYLVGLDRANGRTIAISTWDTEEHAQSISAVGDIASRMQALGLQLEPSEYFELATPT